MLTVACAPCDHGIERNSSSQSLAIGKVSTARANIKQMEWINKVDPWAKINRSREVCSHLLIRLTTNSNVSELFIAHEQNKKGCILVRGTMARCPRLLGSSQAGRNRMSASDFPDTRALQTNPYVNMPFCFQLAKSVFPTRNSFDRSLRAQISPF